MKFFSSPKFELKYGMKTEEERRKSCLMWIKWKNYHRSGSKRCENCNGIKCCRARDQVIRFYECVIDSIDFTKKEQFVYEIVAKTFFDAKSKSRPYKRINRFNTYSKEGSVCK